VFSKLGSRKYLVISLVMTSAFIEADAQGRIVRAGVSVGACAPRSLRLGAVESRLGSLPLAQAREFTLDDEELQPLSPIDDVRASAAFRMRMARELVERDIRSLARKLEIGI
jgi:N-methylhydantoinase B